MASVKFENVSKSFRGKKVLQNVSFEVKDKEFFCILGPPGAGKTTTLKIIAGVVKADEGNVYIDNQLVNDLPPRYRDVSMQFENLVLFPDKTGYENIAFPLRIRRISESEIKESVMRVAKLLKIEHLLDRKPATFSGGERQRVALARAIVRRPKVILLDEPLSNIDALLRINMRVELKRLAKEIGQTIIFSTHDQAEAMSMAERICVLFNGCVEQIGSPNELYNHPANNVVAQMIGSPPMNLNEYFYEEKNGKAYLIGPFKIDVSNYAELLRTSTEFLVGVRPEDLYLSDEPHSERAIKVTIVDYESIGSKTLIKVETNDKKVLEVIGDPWVEYKIDKQMWLDLNPEKIHIFDKKGKALI
ncbi:MAG: ABC transporter ATP-binding protein [Candidatus Methanomethylicia archaeon]